MTPMSLISLTAVKISSPRLYSFFWPRETSLRKLLLTKNKQLSTLIADKKLDESIDIRHWDRGGGVSGGDFYRDNWVWIIRNDPYVKMYS